MKDSDLLSGVAFCKRVDRINVRAADWVTIQVMHPNVAGDVLGEVTLRDMGEVRDLHFLLGRLIQEAERMTPTKRTKE